MRLTVNAEKYHGKNAGKHYKFYHAAEFMKIFGCVGFK